MVALGQLLQRHQSLWRPRPFMDPDVPWRPSLPAAHAWFESLSLDAIDVVEAGISRSDRLVEAFAGADAPAELTDLVERIEATMAPLRQRLPTLGLAPSRRLLWRVPGRKWAQIVALGDVAAVALPTMPDVKRIVDWCSGKGHLGRLLAATAELPVIHLEHQAKLCRVGLELSERAGCVASTTFHEVDVLADSDAAVSTLDGQTVAVALHACGALSSTLTQGAAERGVAGVVASTCCYHKLRDGQDVYAPLSDAARGVELVLDRGALRLPTADEVNAGRGKRLRRRRELAWRQAVQLLVTEASGDPTYRALGAFPRSQLGLPFERFVAVVADELALPLPSAWDPVTAERHGWERARRARGLALLRGCFRRAMETWLIGDQAAWLQQQGYQVHLGTFCPAAITPRNLVIIASRT